MDSFFLRKLEKSDRIIAGAVRSEYQRQQNQIELIASENIVSPAVLEAQGTIFTNKYAEGYPGKRYYGGCEYADVVESAALDRVRQLFDCKFANVQSHSGAQANGTAFLAVLKPGDTFLGLSLDAGGHLTHGAKPTVSGKWFNPVPYGVRDSDCQIDFEQLGDVAREHKPKLIIAGGSAYPRALDFQKFRKIADEVGALLMVDMAHIAGLVAGGVHMNPVHYADIVTSTTHKTLRGPRGGIILTNDAAIAKKIDSAVFPGLQGGPLMHVIAAKAVAFGEALLPEFKSYAQQMVLNAQALAKSLRARKFDLVAGGTDTHLLLVDLRSKGITGDIAERSLERAHLTCNKNGIPFDPQKPSITSGIRLGSAAGTTRGFREQEFDLIGKLIADVLDGLASGINNADIEERTKRVAIDLCNKFPIYNHEALQ